MQPTIQLHVTFQHLTVTSAPLDVLQPLLTVDEWSFRRGPSGRLERLPKQVRLYRCHDSVLRTWPGLLHRVHEALTNAGYSVDVADKRTCVGTATPDLSIVAQLGGDDRKVVEAMSQVFQGYVTAPTGDHSRLIACTCRLFPQARVLIPCDSRDKVDKMHRQLSTWLDEPIGKVVAKDWPIQARIVVCNMQSFNNPNFQDWDMVLFPGIREILHRSTRNNVLNEDWQRVVRKAVRAARADDLSDERRQELQRQAKTFRQYVNSLPPMATYRLYGILPTTCVPTTYEQLRLEQVCGHELHHGQDRPDAQPAQVVFVQIASDATGRRKTPQVSKPLRAWQRKRQGVWHNDARNEAIVSIAAAFAAGDLAALWEHGLLLDAPQDWFHQQGGALRVNILVEVPEHARQLLQRLPGWKLAADLPSTTSAANASPMSLELPYYLDKHVVTAAYVERHGLDADVVIRADGLANRWNTCCGRSTARHQGPMLIVDVFDDHDERAVESARRRIADYRGRGWRVAEQQRLVSCTPLPNRESLLPAGGVAADNLAMQRVTAVESLH